MSDITKTWEVTSDNPRASHAEMAGETVGIKDTFSNGLRFPGDSSTGDAAEVANCTCVMSIEGTVIGAEEARWTDEFAEATKFDPLDARKALADYSRMQGTPIAEIQKSIDDTSQKLIDAAKAHDEAVTNALKEIGAANDSELLGLKFHLKEYDSLRGKLLRDGVEDGFKLTPVENGDAIRDVLRYTFGYDEAAYTDGVQAIRGALPRANLSELKWKPSWDSDVYRGVNAQFRTADGFEFEVQFHTPTSFLEKNGRLHTLYERYRVMDASTDEAIQLLEEIKDITRTIPQPDGWEKLFDVPLRAASPMEPQAFVDLYRAERPHMAPNFEAARQYQGTMYERINESLRGGFEPTDRVSETIEELRAYTNQWSLDEPITVYRGANADMNFSVGGTYSDQGFMSVTVDEGLGVELGVSGGDGLIITTQAGQRYGFGTFGERELIFPPGTEFIVRKVVPKPRGGGFIYYVEVV